MAIQKGWEVWGGGGTVCDCQWPDCRDIAAHRTRRGLEMPWVAVCNRHMLLMRALPDTDAFTASHARQMRRYRKVPNRHIQPTNEDHEARD